MFFLKRYFKFSSFLTKPIFFVFLHQIVWIKFTKQICCKISNFSDIDLDISNISRLFFIGEFNLLIISSEKSFQISIFFNNWFGDPLAEFIKSSNFNFVFFFNLEVSKYSFKNDFIRVPEKDWNLTIWHLEIIVSKRRFNLDASKINMPLLGSSRVFKRQFEAASFKRCASIIKTTFFSEFIDFWLRKVLILRIWAILIISDPFFIVF